MIGDVASFAKVLDNRPRRVYTVFSRRGLATACMPEGKISVIGSIHNKNACDDWASGANRWLLIPSRHKRFCYG